MYDDKKKSLERLKDNITRLPNKIKSRLTIENNDKNFTPEDLLPLCQELEIPFVYDIHHHRCAKDNLSIKDAT